MNGYFILVVIGFLNCNLMNSFPMVFIVCRGGAFCVDDFGISCKKVIYV